MITDSAEDLQAMGLRADSDTVEKIKLSNYARRAELYTKFVNTNPTQANDIQWAKENFSNDGHKCNFPVIMCELEGTIPGSTPKKVNEKYYTDMEENGNWISKYLTSASYEHKQISKVISSDTSKYKVSRYFNYLLINVLNAAGKHVANYLEVNKNTHADLKKEHVAARWILLKCNIDVGH